MSSLSLVFHFAAGIAFFILGLATMYLINEKKYFEKSLKLGVSSKNGAFLVDWPLQFLKKWCRFVGIRLIGNGNPKLGRPCKITPSNWFAFYLKFGIELVAVEQGGNRPKVLITPAQKVPSKNEWLRKLEESFGSSLEFDILT